MKKYLMRVCLPALLVCLGLAVPARHKTELTPEDWRYKLGEGVTAKEVAYYSDGIACYAKVFFPKGFSATAKTPGVVLGQGWAGTHFWTEKYAARFAERGLVAMAIDYRGWGSSDGFIAPTQATVTRADNANPFALDD